VDPADQPPESPTIEHVLAEIRKNAFKGGALCTGWIVISEWLDADGDYWTHVERDDRNPPWRHQGLLQHALDEEELDDDEWEDDEDD